MLVLFNGKNKEYLRVFQGATQDMKERGVEVNEADIPKRDGYRTVIYKIDKNNVEYKFEKIQNKKDDISRRVEALELMILEMMEG